MTESRWRKMVTKWEKANQYDNDIQELEQIKTILRHNAYTTKAFNEKLKVIRKPEIISKLCSSDFQIIIDSDDNDYTVILSDHEDDIYCNDHKTLCFIFFSEFHKNNILNYQQKILLIRHTKRFDYQQIYHSLYGLIKNTNLTLR